MNKYFSLAVVLLFFLSSCKESRNNNAPIEHPKLSRGVEDTLFLSYFTSRVIKDVYETLEVKEVQGLGGEVDGFTLRKTYKKLVPEDFNGVIARGGEYSAKKGELFYTGNAASDSPVIEKEGMRTFLLNLQKRFKLLPNSKAGMDSLIEKIR